MVLLKRQYPRFAISRYTHFLVLTQSCDLVLRSGVCKASHVSLAAVVPLQLVLETRIRAEQDEFERAAGVGSSKLRGELRQFLERLLNNNEPDSFYLHEDSGLGLAQGSCAFLRLSIPVEAVPNYDLLLESRILSLT
ncbi:MAG: hypothetical protein FJX77_06900, partial [Armatimonadetes bacterium]|nr:hypothetical protein [Armatimonadota bacterium]